MKKLIVIVAVAALILPMLASAEIMAYSFVVNPNAGFHIFDQDNHFAKGAVYGIRLGYNITNRFGVEVI